MLKLSLLPEEYLTINGDIVIQLSRVAGGRAFLAIEADRTVPVIRGRCWSGRAVSAPPVWPRPAEKPSGIPGIATSPGTTTGNGPSGP